MEVDPEELTGRYWQRIDRKFSELKENLEKLGFNPELMWKP